LLTLYNHCCVILLKFAEHAKTKLHSNVSWSRALWNNKKICYAC